MSHRVLGMKGIGRCGLAAAMVAGGLGLAGTAEAQIVRAFALDVETETPASGTLKDDVTSIVEGTGANAWTSATEEWPRGC